MKYYKISRFWLIYFFIRLFYLFFTVFIYTKLTQVSDMVMYLNADFVFSLRVFLGSTYFMESIGGLIGSIFNRNMFFSNFPFMLFSFFIVKWTVEKLSLRKHINNMFLMALLSIPNFCIWTSICSKEVFGLTFSGLIAVLTINFMNNNYKIRIRDIFGLYLCLLFKPQYAPFILQGLLFIYMVRKIMNRKPGSQLFLGIIFLAINLLFLYLMKDMINKYAGLIQNAFYLDMGKSNRDNIFLKENDFFRYIPYGMFIAFWGPTLNEMLSRPLQFIAGIESLCIIASFLYLSKNMFFRFLIKGRTMPLIVVSYLIVFMGICFIHYPFGVFNPGSAIRYRNNFLFLFIILLLYLYSWKQKYYLIGKKDR